MSPAEVLSTLDIAKGKLWEYRSKVRPKPHRDEKVQIYYTQIHVLTL